MTVDDFQKMQREIAQAEKEFNQNSGQMVALERELKEVSGCDDLTQAQKLLKSTEDKVKKLTTEVDKLYTNFGALWTDYLNGKKA